MPDLLDTRAAIPVELHGDKTDITDIQRAEVIRLKLLGTSSRAIAKSLDIPEANVRRLIRQAVETARASERDLILERFHIQDQRLEYLIGKIFAQIEAMIDFDERLIRSAILVCDRQAKLLGLDKTKTSIGADWLASAGSDDLIRMARERGIPLPKRFECN